MSKNTVPVIVSTDWLAGRLDDPRLRLLDASLLWELQDNKRVYYGKKSYDEGHIPGAVFADVPNELSDPNGKYDFTVPTHEFLVEKISALGIGDDTYVVVYDREQSSSVWASRVWWLLRLTGFENVSVLEGGYLKWQSENRPISTENHSYPKGNFTGERRPELLATLEDVKKAIDDDSTVLIHSLHEKLYNGETDPYGYGRKGHIPSSVNVFYEDLTNAETRELHDDTYNKALFEKQGVLDENKKIIAYCGGGIGATWNALVLAKLGKENAAIYDGSINEWVSDPTLPLVTIESVKSI